ncbi:MAG: anthrone oxygenase family protein [Streptosporangiales bacterium]
MQEILAVITVVVVGLMVGVELAVAVFVNPIFDRLPNDGGLVARSDGARVLGRVMPFWYIGSVVLGSLWAAQAWGRPQALTVAVAAALLVVSVGMSIVLLVPINSRVAQWSGGNAPPDWREQVSRWDRLHYLRVGIIVAAFALLVVAGVA